DAPLLPGHALQPLREPAVRPDLPDGGDVPPARRDRGVRPGGVHRLQGVPAGVPLRRDPHRPGVRHGGQVPLLRPPHRRRTRARVRRRLPGARDPRRGHRRSRLRGRPRRLDRARLGPQARAGDPPEALLHRGGGLGALSDARLADRGVSLGADAVGAGRMQMWEGGMAGGLVRSAAAPRETYNVGHRVPWHWQVPAYLVTKAIGAGMLLIAAIGTALGWLPESPLFVTAAPILALLLTAV